MQDHLGRQAMTPLTLHFSAGAVSGEGRDRVGPFTFDGEYNESTGEVRMVKQYLGRHTVLYVGHSDGEGSIQGTWSMGKYWTGPFLLRPALRKPTGEEPIQEIG